MDDGLFVIGSVGDEQLESAAINPSPKALSHAKLSALTRISDRILHSTTPCNDFGRMVLNATCQAVLQQETSDIAAIAPALIASGLDVAIRRATGDASAGKDVFRSLRHEFLVVRGTGEFLGMEFIVEPSLRQHFLVPHPSPEYEYVLSRTPDVFVGGSCRLAPVVQLLCALMADSFQRQGLPLPPWRTEAAMLSKWLPQPHLCTEVVLWGLASPPPAAPAAVSPSPPRLLPPAAAASPPPLPSPPVVNTQWLLTMAASKRTTGLLTRADSTSSSSANCSSSYSASSNGGSSDDGSSNDSPSSSGASSSSRGGACNGGVSPLCSSDGNNSCSGISISVSISSSSSSSSLQGAPHRGGTGVPGAEGMVAGGRGPRPQLGRQSSPDRRVVWGFETRLEQEQRHHQQQQQHAGAGRNEGVTVRPGGRQGTTGRAGQKLGAIWDPLLPNGRRDERADADADADTAVAAAAAVAVTTCPTSCGSAAGAATTGHSPPGAATAACSRAAAAAAAAAGPTVRARTSLLTAGLRGGIAVA